MNRLSRIGRRGPRDEKELSAGRNSQRFIQRPASELTSEKGGHRWLPILALVLVGIVVPFFQLGEYSTLGTHEVYTAVPAREMLQSGNWIVPQFGGLPRLKKPPLAYWLVATSSALFGEMNEWTIRFPSALSSLLLAVLIGVWAGRWYGWVGGLSAAFVQLTSLYVLIYGRKAEVDITLCLLTTAALFLVAGHQPKEPRSRAVLRFFGVYCLLSLSWLAKFHYGPVMVLGPSVVYFLIQERYRALLHLANPLGLAVFAAAVFVWPYLVLQQFPDAWNIWQVETVGRAVGAFGHAPIWFYIPQIFGLTMPWAPFAILVASQSWKRAWCEGNVSRRFFKYWRISTGDPHERFLWVWFFTVLLIVTLSANKHKHYIFAALPMLSLLSAQRFVVLADRSRHGRPLIGFLSVVGLILGCLGTAIGALVVVSSQWPELLGPTLAASAILAIGGCYVTWLLARQKATASAYGAVALILVCYVIATGWIIPGCDHRLPIAYFARTVRRDVSPTQPVHVYRLGQNPIVYYLDEPVFRVESLHATKEALTRRGRLTVVSHEQDVSELSQIGHQRVLRRMPARQGAKSRKSNQLVLVELRARQTAQTGLREHSKR